MRISGNYNNFYANTLRDSTSTKKATGFAQALGEEIQKQNIDSTTSIENIGGGSKITDPYKNLSGDELFAAIVKRYDGGAIVASGRDMWEPLDNMLYDLTKHGFITVEQGHAISEAAITKKNIAMALAEQKLGSHFTKAEYDNFLLYYRFSFNDVLSELMDSREYYNENDNRIELYTPEERQELINIVNKAISVLN